ncbi:threonine/serine exporter ThrE family protein [Shewanella sp. NIFS-20-20]|uniref:threonine/serine ThrE exporter family protein n=1 Tax=Shewanella sp. NIFS-20-20 TaxID=2853806 RepID=UPI001C46ABCF|nr:threonine/serine exporter family protein [Shewanella sp. NIFS-20-20]MBV7315647.1 threonine/serine exporter family protein [Shewanella sp. NIFS-20-20]
MEPIEFALKRRFIIKLGKALHQYGTPAYRLETHLRRVSAHLGLDGYFLITPTTMTFVLNHGDDQEYNHMARVKPGDLDLGSLARCDDLVDEVLDGSRDLGEANERLTEIIDKPSAYNTLVTGMAFTLTPAAFSMLIASGWHDVLWSCPLGMMVFILVKLAEKSPRLAEMLEPLAAIICAFSATAIAFIDPLVNIPVLILSGIIVFVPGLALTLGLAELAARDLISGTARIMDALMLLCKLYFGGLLGIMLAQAIFGTPTTIMSEPLPRWALWSAVPFLSCLLVVLFKARPKDAPWGISAGIIAFVFAMLGGIYLGESIGIFVGALAVGIYANLYSRWMHAPATIALLQGIVILVPGSKTYLGLSSLVSGQVVLNQAHIGSQVFLIFMSLIAGLIFANVAVPPRSTL